ncbi:hypothetical protein [Halioxenophilus sp. WMMB6]|uniref:hypothetical protein n=1 Tax=Halioxenophilus sp. WMMB6 TaxID=3073815 RepID=UPI00295EBDE6|nr:hypothetical protein [Halioxenophilus sp. WMMB6]
MKYLVLAFLLLLNCGCTSLKPVELTPEQLQEKIVADDLIKPGDKIKAVTADGERHTFVVTAIEDNQVLGKDVSIPIDEIIALETVSFSGGKTSALVGGTLLWLYIILLSIPAIVAV